jgi:hypothetical protein
MKKILILVFVIFAQFTNAQTENAQIQKDFESMIEFTRKNQFDKVIDMTYPRFVKVFGKQGLTAMTTGILTSMGIKFVVEENPINLKMSSLTKLKDGSICMGEYDNSMILEFNDEAMVQFFTMAPLDGYKIEKLGSKKIRMAGKAFLLAINDSYTNKTWKYLNYSDDLAKMPEATKVVTQELIDESAKLKSSFN